MATTLTQSTLTPEQIEVRRTGIGASEIAAVLGLHHKLTPLDIWMQKRGIAEPQFDNQYLKMGRILEGVIRQMYYEEIARPANLVMLENVGTKVHKTEPWMLCTPDAILRDNVDWVRGLECKNRDAFVWRDQFGESGTEHYPDDVAAQCYWSMAVTGLDRWDIAVLLGGNDFRTYTVHRSQELIDAMVEQAREFWFTNVVGGKEPPIIGRSAKDYLKKRFTLHSADLIEATPDVAEYLREYAEVKVRLKQLFQAKDDLEAILCAEVGSNAGIKSRYGTFSWKMKKGYPVKAHDVAATRVVHWSAAKV